MFIAESSFLQFYNPNLISKTFIVRALILTFVRSAFIATKCIISISL